MRIFFIEIPMAVAKMQIEVAYNLTKIGSEVAEQSNAREPKKQIRRKKYKSLDAGDITQTFYTQ